MTPSLELPLYMRRKIRCVTGSASRSVTDSLPGTAPYMAPEILINVPAWPGHQTGYDKEIDMSLVHTCPTCQAKRMFGFWFSGTIQLKKLSLFQFCGMFFWRFFETLSILKWENVRELVPTA